MKITYEFDSEREGDMNERMLFEIASDMHSALFNIQTHLREYQKERCDFTIEELVSLISGFIEDSEIYKIE